MTTKVRSKYSVCTICDIGCQLRAIEKDGYVNRILAHDNPLLSKNICYKGTAAPHIHNHVDRLRVPLKRVGERGEDCWEEISYKQAMDEIAERLKGVIDRYGAEGIAVSTSGWNTQTTHSMDRRFMNLIGAPNWISGVALCAGNTAAVNRLTYGWFPMPDFGNTNCIVLFGHNPRKHSWTPIYNAIKSAKARGAKIYAELIGYGMSGDAHHITAPAEDGDGGFRAMKQSINMANISLEDINYVNAHGTSTIKGDEIELNAIMKLFNNHENLFVSSTKSSIGHLLGAAGSVESIFAILAINNSIVPGTLNLKDPIDSKNINLVANEPKETKINIALSNSFGFGGTNTALLFKNY